MPPIEGEAPESSTGNAGSEGQEQSYLQEQPGANQPSGPESPAPDQGASSPESPPGAGEQKPYEGKSPLDVVNDAMKANEGGDSPPPDQDGKPADQTQDSEKAGKEGDDQTGEEGKQAKEGEEGKDDKDKPPPFHNHPRWKEMVNENKELKTRVEEYEATYKEPAERYERINQFLVDHDLGGDDFKNMLDIGAAMKNDPTRALELIEPYYQGLLRANGKVLPDDVKEKLDAGYIDEDTAYAMAAERARNQNLESRLDRDRQRQEQTEEQRRHSEERSRHEKLTKDMQSAVAAWEQQWSSDPDYSKLMPFVRDRVVSMMRQEMPDSPEKAVEIAKQAKEAVEKEMAAVMPKKEPIEPLNGGASTPTQPRAEPKSSLDVVNNALANS